MTVLPEVTYPLSGSHGLDLSSLSAEPDTQNLYTADHACVRVEFLMQFLFLSFEGLPNLFISSLWGHFKFSLILVNETTSVLSWEMVYQECIWV